MARIRINWVKVYWIVLPIVWALVIYLRVNGKANISNLNLVFPPFLMLLLFLNSRVSKREPMLMEGKWEVICGQDRFTSIDYNRKEVAVMLSEILAISIETNDKGPFETDVWWQIRTGTGILSIPGVATGEAGLLKLLGTLEGFSHEAVIEAMGSTANRTFNIFTRTIPGHPRAP